MSDNKRRFTRIPFVSQITLMQDQQRWQGNAVDISFKGILINLDQHDNNELCYTEDKSNPYESIIQFDNNDELHIGLELAHSNNSLHGFRFTEMDMDAMSHLRNIVMLNLGNDTDCERELMSLFSYHQ